MKKYIFSLLLSIGLVSFGGTIEGKLESKILATGSSRVVQINQSGEIIWEFPAGNIHDAWLLENGNVLFADGEIKEVTPDKKVVFRFKPQNTNGEGAYSCQPLPDNKILIGDNSTGCILEVDRQTGNITFELKTVYQSQNKHQVMRMARKLPNGNYLVCHSGDNIVKEYAPDGKVVWQQKTKGLAFAAVRLKNGNTVISSLNQITEYDSKGNEVWEFKKSDLPNILITNMTGIQALPNGNIVIGIYGVHTQQVGTGCLEITRDKKLVWRYYDVTKRDHNMMGIHVPTNEKIPNR